jgi:hypothetical protein
MTLAARQALWFALVLVLPAGAQSVPGGTHNSIPEPMGQRAGSGMDDSTSGDDIDQEKRLRALNADRQKSMVSDTNKLLKLANELNAEVSTANSQSLTPAQLHKLGQIEKLAHNVKEKMSTSVRPIFQQQPVPFVP